MRVANSRNDHREHLDALPEHAKKRSEQLGDDREHDEIDGEQLVHVPEPAAVPREQSDTR